MASLLRSGGCVPRFQTHTGGVPRGRAISRAAGRAALLCAAAAALTGCAAGGAADTAGSALAVAPTGSDAGGCAQNAPCRTFDRAYRVAAPGQVVHVAGGAYPEPRLNADPTKTAAADLFFRPAAGARVRV